MLMGGPAAPVHAISVDVNKGSGQSPSAEYQSLAGALALIIVFGKLAVTSYRHP